MKRFERFIIYPLLAVALINSFLGGALVQAGTDLGSMTAKFRKVVTKEISIVNDEGEEVANFKGGRLDFYHGQDVIARIETREDGTAGIGFGQNNQSVEMGINRNGVVGIFLENEKGNKIQITGYNEGRIDFFDAKNKNKLTLGLLNNEGYIICADNNDAVKSILNGREISFYEEKLVATMGTVVGSDVIEGTGYIFLYNKHGDPLVSIGSSDKGHGAVFTYDKYGEDCKVYGYYK